MAIKKQFYSWSNLIKDCSFLANKLKLRKFDFVVAISRGGLMPTALLAYLLKIKKVGSISYSHYIGDDIRGKLELVLAPSEKIKNSRVLLVDDKADTGLTLIAAKNFLERKNNKIVTVTLHYAPRSKIKPDLYRRKVKNIWIVYPWELPAKK